MSTIADKIRELRMIEREQREFLTIPDGVTFKDYINFMEWKPPSQKLYLDFVSQRYGMDGEKCTLQDVFDAGLLDFTRLSKAWQFENSKLEEYDVNEPRFSGKGLLIEPESTNGFLNNNTYHNYTSIQGRADKMLIGDSFVGEAVKWVAKVNYTGTQVTRDYPVGTSTPSDLDLNRGILIKKGFSRYVSLRRYSGAVGLTVDTVDVVAIQLVRIAENDYILRDHGEWLYVEFVYTGGGAVSSYSFDISFSNTPPTHTYDLDVLIGDECVVAYPLMSVGQSYLGSTTIKTGNSPVTRLPETLSVLTDSSFTIEADEGVQVNGNEITGFGYIRKLEVK